MNSSINHCIGLLSLTKIRNSLLLPAALLVGFLQSAGGQDIYVTGFEAPALVAGDPLAGQDGWVAGAGPVPQFLSDNAAVITAGKHGGQTVRVEGADLVHQDIINGVTGGYYDAIGSYRRAVNHDTGGSQTVRISADVRLDGKRTPHSNFFSASIVAIAFNDEGGNEGVGELAISSDGHVYGSSGQDLVPVFLTSTHVALGISHNLAIEVDFAERTYSFYVDGEWLGTFDFEPFEPSGVLRRGSIVTYAAPDTKTDKKADHAATIDNFAIEVVSE
ncbi:MAG: hypothetical protein ACKV19_19695 [Verrucomicrobiales bacterium]